MPIRALVADDDRMSALIVRKTLERLGLETMVAHDGSEAWKILQGEPIDLAVLDWMMPFADGPELCRRIRQDPACARMYVLLLTGKNDSADLVTGLDAGADDYLIKPLNPEEFRARIDVGLRVLSLQARVAERVAELEVATTALKSSVERYKRLVESTHAVPWEMDGETLAITYIAPQATSLYGYAVESLLEPDFAWNAIHQDDRDRVKSQFAKLASSDDDSHLETEYQIVTLAGRTLHVRGIVSVHGGGDGRKVLRGIALDITEQKKLELELRGAQKLESVGRLAAGVAHEINTPVQFVSDSVHFVRDAMGDLATLVDKYRTALQSNEVGESVREAASQAEADADLEYLTENVPKALDRSLEGLERVATIVRSMKEFAHPDQTDMALVNLNQAVQSTLVIARNEYKYVADVEAEYGEIPPVTCYAGEVNQAILNIVVNAAHAIAEKNGGTEERGRIALRTWTEGDSVLISIGDTGGGIPDSIRERVFDPFFTTKEVGKGTGQGLAIARSVIHDKHGGELTFETQPGHGTTFFIRLPISASARDSVAA
jgi:two-component system, NtrC family, sensor kinase